MSSPPRKLQKMTTTVDALDAKALNRFSRQNAALGADTTAKLIKMRVLICGMRGVGIETAKNLALQGVGAITVLDNKPTEMKDLGVNFFLNEADVSSGISRAAACAPRIQELNPLCAVAAASALTEDVILQHSALVITEPTAVAEIVRLNEFCRLNGVAFFFCFTGGVFMSIFADLGAAHIVNDFNGERPVQKLITDVSSVGAGECLIRYETPEGQQPIALSQGYFEVTEVVGVDGINGKVYSVDHPYSDPVKTIRIPLDISTCMVGYSSGGLLTEKKVPTPYPMESFATKMKTPGSTFASPPSLVLTDLINFGSELQQHVAMLATFTYADQTGGKLPRPNSSDDTAEVVKCAKSLLASGQVAIDDFELDEAFVTKFALHAGVELQAMAAFAGGVLAQEVVKCTGKFTPIPGFMHFSTPEVLPDVPPSMADTLPRSSRYDELAAVFGWPFVERLSSLKYFMVGCGALGCEFMKNFALNNVCCGPQGKLVVTDADRIEMSNLSRQFLFREHNVGQPKSRAAAAMAGVMNPAFNVEALELFVGPKTEDQFNDDFWQNLDGVCNALDNMEARQYVDVQCVKYEKSLLESGTMGTSGNVDTICPFKTRTYGDGGNAAEGGGVPMCTLRNFPHLTDHCIEWGRDQFELLFKKIGKSCETYLANPAAFEIDKQAKAGTESGLALFDIRSVTSMFRAAANPSMGTIAQVAFDLFHFMFRDRILDLQSAFPADKRMVDKDTGADKGPFWGEKKRYPTVLTFNPADEVHTSFLLSTTCLLAVALGVIPAKAEEDDQWLKEYRSPEFVANLAAGLSPPPYVQAPVTSPDIEGAAPVPKDALDTLLQGLFTDLRDAAATVKHLTFNPAEFEKDDDLNFHIAFITSAANLRCDNYSINRTDFHACKVIAGKIIAAIATTTAAVCGLVLLEMFKLVQGKGTVAYMNRAIGLAVNSYTSFTQEEPIKHVTYTERTVPTSDELSPDAFDEKGNVKEDYVTKTVKRAYPDQHSVWDKLSCPGSLTLKQFAEWLQNDHGVRMTSWDFIYGHKTVDDEDNQKTKVAVSCPVYPPKPLLDYSLVPALDLTLPQATQAIMRTAAAKPTQQYIALWKECKASGVIPSAAATVDNKDAITETTSLAEILAIMSRLAESAEKAKIIESRCVPSLVGRKIWVIPGSETPVCCDYESGEEIESLAAIKILL